MNISLIERRCPRCQQSVAPDAPEALCPACLLESCVGWKTTCSFHPELGATSGEASQPPSLDELAAWFPRLEILDYVGGGGMGLVYRARQRGLERLVALKILRHDRARSEQFAERFEREAQALARLDHPHIVGVHESGRAGPYCYLVMEYVDGTTLRELMTLGKLEPTHALELVPQLCDALAYAHQRGVVHRDIKPENILIDATGQVKIADFGLAKIISPVVADTTLTQPHHVLGTMHYMAPEQMRGLKEVDHRADIYSLGVVLYEMLTGELPVGRFERPSQHSPVDARIDDLVLRSLERDPNRRYQQVEQIRTELESIADQPAARVTATNQLLEAERERVAPSILTLPLLIISLLLFASSFLPLGVAAIRSKFDLDQQFVRDQQQISGSPPTAAPSIYWRLAGWEWAVFPEGESTTAWGSTLNIRPRSALSGWLVRIPNLIAPLLSFALVLLLAYERAGRMSPPYILPSLAALGTAYCGVLARTLNHQEIWCWGALVMFLGFLALSIGAILRWTIRAVTRQAR